MRNPSNQQNSPQTECTDTHLQLKMQQQKTEGTSVCPGTESPAHIGSFLCKMLNQAKPAFPNHRSFEKSLNSLLRGRNEVKLTGKATELWARHPSRETPSMWPGFGKKMGKEREELLRRNGGAASWRESTLAGGI